MQSFIGSENPFSAKPSVTVVTRGRGFGTEHRQDDNETRYAGSTFDTYTASAAETAADAAARASDAQRSVEGWVIIVSNVHEEAQEDDVTDVFGEFGSIKQCHLNLNRRTGYTMGYALIEYADFTSARDAILRLNGAELLGKTIQVDWAFKKPPRRTAAANNNSDN